MLVSIIVLAAGLAILAVAAGQFVVGAARVAVRLRLSPVVVGAVVIGFGTSAPELVVSALAARDGSLELAAGNVVGSNVANLTLVLGVTALITPVGVTSPTLRREAPLCAAAVALFAVLVQAGLTRPEGLVLVGALVVVLTVVVVAPPPEDRLETEVSEFVEGDGARPPVRREVLRTAGGLAGTLVGAQLIVTAARELAAAVGLAEGFVGLTVVAVGTSLPELATGVQAARRAETDLLVGNLLGSNIFNSLGVGGVAALAGPGALVDPALTVRAVLLMVVVTTVAVGFMLSGRQVVGREGAVLLGAYVVALPLLA